MENIPNGSVAAYTVGPDGPSEGSRRGGGVRGRGGEGPPGAYSMRTYSSYQHEVNGPVSVSLLRPEC